jgi:hypothetical protein
MRIENMQREKLHDCLANEEKERKAIGEKGKGKHSETT